MRKRNRVDVTSSLYEVCRMPTPNEHNYDYGSIIKTVLLAFLVVFLLQNGNLREISGYIARTSRMLINKIEPQHFNNQPQTFREQQNLIIENQNLKEELKKAKGIKPENVYSMIEPDSVVEKNDKTEFKDIRKKCRLVSPRERTKCLKGVSIEEEKLRKQENEEIEWILDL